MTTTIETRLVRTLDAARVAAHAEVQAVNVTWDEAYRNGQMDVLRSDVEDATDAPDTSSLRRAGRPQEQSRGGRGPRGEGDWWDAEPDVGRVADGMADGMDRLRAIGNGQVPAVVRLAWETISGR